MSTAPTTPTTNRLSELKPGARIKPGNEFWGCVPFRAIRTVRCDDGGLYVKCREGHHYLDRTVCVPPKDMRAMSEDKPSRWFVVFMSCCAAVLLMIALAIASTILWDIINGR